MPTVEPADFVASAGQGLQCVVDGAVVLLGNRSWVHENGLALSAAQEAQVARLEETGHTVVLAALSRDEGGGGLYLAGCLAVADALKPDAAGVIRQLQQQGKQVWMVSGDNPRTARYIAQLAGLAPEFVVAGVKPEGKLAKVRATHTPAARCPPLRPHAPQPATPCISRASPAHLPCISGASPVHLPRISRAPPVHLPRISRASPVHLRCRSCATPASRSPSSATASTTRPRSPPPTWAWR